MVIAAALRCSTSHNNNALGVADFEQYKVIAKAGLSLGHQVTAQKGEYTGMLLAAILVVAVATPSQYPHTYIFADSQTAQRQATADVFLPSGKHANSQHNDLVRLTRAVITVCYPDAAAEHIHHIPGLMNVAADDLAAQAATQSPYTDRVDEVQLDASEDKVTSKLLDSLALADRNMRIQHGKSLPRIAKAKRRA